jgi:hypothetical protein
MVLTPNRVVIAKRSRLGEEPAEPAELKALLKPTPSEEMIYWPVSPRVGNVRAIVR